MFSLAVLVSFGNLPGPTITCVSVLPNGDVSISWNQVSDPSGIFVKYEIFEVGTSGLISLQSISSRTTINYVHTSATANINAKRYIISTTTTNPTTNFSDTVSSMRLFVNNPSNGMAILNWNPVFSPNNSFTASNWYKIYREFPTGNWTLIDSVQYGNEYYRDTITVCSDSINYRVTNSNTNCTSVSSVDGKNFNDVIPPYAPIITSVTVDTSNNLGTVRWNPSKPNDTRGYIILKNISGAWVPIDTVYGINNTIYQYNLSTAYSGSECFGVAAFDSCYYGSPLTPNTSAMSAPHCSVYLNEVYQACNKTINLAWNSYSGWNSGISNYEVLQSLNGGDISKLGTTTSNTFIVSNLKPDSLYCFTIQSISGNQFDTSLSNKICIETVYPYISDTNYLQTVTVVNENRIDLRIYTTPSNTVKGYDIFRSEDEGITFNSIGFAPNTTIPITFSDRNVNSSSFNYQYHVKALDSCNNSVDDISNTSKNILLKTSINQNNYKVSLHWNYFTTWIGLVQEYRVYRKLGSASSTLIATLPSTINKYEDDISNFYSSSDDGKFCYEIEAIENTNSYLISETSFSNESCITPNELIYVPNSFTPNSNGINDKFKPVIGFADFSSYKMSIYNRLGQEIFTTKDINEGWDGTKNSESLQNGIYIYSIQINNTEGKPINLTGTIALFYE